MSNKGKSQFKPWGDDNNPGKDVANAAWKGTKAVGVAVVAGLAIGLGLGAMDAASG